MSTDLVISQADYSVCAVCIAVAKHTCTPRQATILLRSLVGMEVRYTNYDPHPLQYMWATYYAARTPTTYAEFYKQTESFQYLKTICNHRIESYIQQLNQGTLPWKIHTLTSEALPQSQQSIQELTLESSTYLTHHSLHSTRARVSSNSTNSTATLNKPKISLDQLRSRMDTLMAKASKVSL